MGGLPPITFILGTIIFIASIIPIIFVMFKIFYGSLFKKEINLINFKVLILFSITNIIGLLLILINQLWGF